MASNDAPHRTLTDLNHFLRSASPTKSDNSGSGLRRKDAYIIRSNGPSRIARHKLDHHCDVPKQILILGSKSRSWPNHSVIQFE